MEPALPSSPLSSSISVSLGHQNVQSFMKRLFIAMGHAIEKGFMKKNAGAGGDKYKIIAFKDDKEQHPNSYSISFTGPDSVLWC